MSKDITLDERAVMIAHRFSEAMSDVTGLQNGVAELRAELEAGFSDVRASLRQSRTA